MNVRAFALLILVPTAISLVAAAPPVQYIPGATKGKPYPVVRRTLMRAGWAPVALPNAQQCTDDRCRGFREVFFCAGTGEATCWYAWRKGKSYLMVAAVGENVGQSFERAFRCSRIDPASDSWDDWCKR